MTQKTKAEIVYNINNDIVSNSEKRVTPEDIRRNLIDIVDSISILSTDEYIVSANLSTHVTRNTRVGIEALDKAGVVPGYNSQDNTAGGFHALYANYNGDGNSAWGSYALGCNIYGDENTAIGWHALSVNQDGDQNVALGTHALKGLKHGNNNIAIGAYAGYYINESENFKFFLGSHDLTPQETCDNPSGSGLTPLMYGDLLNNVLVIGYTQLHNEGKLQVNGSVTPARMISEVAEPGNLGSTNYPWNKVYLREINSDLPYVSVNNNLLPTEDGVFTLGDQTHRWNTAYINNIVVNGSAAINDLQYNQITESQYLNRTLYLASSGTNALNSAPSPYLTDEGIDGGGIVIQSSGVSYRRNYSLLYRAPNLTWTYANTAYAKSSWESNISLVVQPDCFIKTDRLIGRSKLLVSNDTPTRNGMTFDDHIVIGKESLRNEYYGWEFGGQFNHIVDTGVPIYSQNVFAKGSGISIENNELSRYDGTLDEIYGFSSTYDDKNGKIKKRFIGYAGNPSGTCSFTIDALNGRAGFSNRNIDFDPVTTFNIFGSGNSILRNSSLSKASIQLSVNDNNLVKGIDISHSESDNKTRVSIYRASTPHEVFSVGESGFAHETPVAILETSGTVTPQENYGTLIVRPNSSPIRSQSIFLQDDQGREFDLLADGGDIFNDDFVYHDPKKNTLLGYFSNDTKDKIYESGGYENTAIGYEALDGVVTGSGNIAVGYRSGYGIKSGNNNVLIGHKLSTTDLSNALMIGNGTNVIVYGEIPTSSAAGFFGVDERFEITKKGANEKVEIVQQDHDTIIRKVSKGKNLQTEVVDELGGFMGSKPTSSLFFDFVGTTTHRLMELNASGSLNSSYVFTNTRPYATIKGDLNLYGDLRFPDGTAITSASGLQITAGTGIAIIPISGVKEISFSISNIPTYGGPIADVDSNLVVETSGVVKRCPVSQLMQYVNHTNPQMYFNCPGGYNLVLSNNSAIYHNQNCNTIFGGFEAGDDATGFTNSVVLGTQAGQEAYFNNTSNLTIDTAAVFIGYNAGRKSRNADNSIFIGPSAGQHSVNTDNSIFIGNSAGEGSKSAKSISIGDNTLETVEGENNIEIVANREDFNRILGGRIDHKMSLGAVVAADTCVGRVSVGGAARVFPTASVESSSKFGDNTVPVHKWFNADGDLVAYLDQQGNMVLKGAVMTSSYMNETNLVPGIMPTGLPCGNQNISGNTPNVILPNTGGDNGDNGDGDTSLPPSGYMLGYTPIYNEI